MSKIYYEQSFIEVYKKALAPENITDGVYYLDSEKSKFNISTISTPTLSYNSASGEISWEEKAGANSYRVYITMPSAIVKEIITSETSLNLSEEISASEFKSGQYEITIIAMPEDDA